MDDVPDRSCYSQYFKAAHFFAGPRDKPTQRVITQFFRKYSPPPTVHLFLFFIPIRKYQIFENTVYMLHAIFGLPKIFLNI